MKRRPKLPEELKVFCFFSSEKKSFFFFEKKKQKTFVPAHRPRPFV
jgi:hypothetical protein